MTKKALTIPLSLTTTFSAWEMSDTGNTKKLAVLLPGFLDTKDYEHLIQLGISLQSHGYTAVSFDPPGIWESRGPIEHYSITNYLQSIDAVIAYEEQKNKTPLSVVLCGHSLGGMLAILGGIKNSHVTAAVAIMPPQSFIRPENYERRVIQWKQNIYKESIRDNPANPKTSTTFFLPYSFVTDALEYSAIRDVSKFTKPILLLAGELDTHITPAHVEELYKKANEPKEYVVLSGIGHNYRTDKEQIKKVNDTILQFLKKHE
jgi:alpha-beta hydrolase superfamily lysophospholipase